MSRTMNRGAAPVGVAKRILPAVVVGIVLISLAAGCNLLGTAPPDDPGSPVVIAAGDIADCSSEGDDSTAKLLEGVKGTIITLGDNAYENGTSQDFADCYDPTWGRIKDRTKPSPGNHDYNTPGARGYFGYFGQAAGKPGKGYYSYDIGGWHLVALNSNCQYVGGCDSASRQGRWLKDDLAANRSRCTLAYFHYPLFSSGLHGNQTQMRPFWDILYAADADVVLNGHDHDYQRYVPQAPDGSSDPERGIREFVVGTGGMLLYPIEDPPPNLETYNDDTYGVLRLTLHPKSYEWQFLSAQGSSYTDSGKGRCV